MKKIISLLLTFALLFSLCPTAFAADVGVTLTVNADKETVLPGEQVTFDIKVSNPITEPITAIGFTLGIPNELEYVSHTDGFEAIQTGNEGTDFESNYNKDKANFAAYTGTAIDSAEWTVLRITFKVADDAEAGAKTLSLERNDYLVIGNASYESVEFAPADGSIEVVTPVASPIVISDLTAPVRNASPDTDVTLPTGMTVSALTWKTAGEAISGTYAAGTIYTAEITYTVDSDYGLPSDVTVTVPAGAESASIDTDAGLITVTYPATEGALTGEIDLGIKAPVSGAAPQYEVSTTDYTGSISWSPTVNDYFEENTPYTATVTLTLTDANSVFDGTTVKGAATVNISDDGKTLTANFEYAATETVTGYYWDFNGDAVTNVTGNGWGANELTPNTLGNGALDMAHEITLSGAKPWTIEWKGGFAQGTGKIYGVPLAFNTSNDTTGAKAGAFVYICHDFDKVENTNKICVVPAGASDSHGSSIIGGAIVDDATVRDEDTVWTITHDGQGVLTIMVALNGETRVFQQRITDMPNFTFNGVKGFLWTNLGVCADDSMDYMKIMYSAAEVTAEAQIGNVMYSTLEDAVAAATTGQYPTEVAEATTITLLKDVSSGFDVGVEAYPLGTNFKTQNIVLNLNEHTLTLGDPAVGSGNTKDNGIRVLAFSQLAISNGTIAATTALDNVINNYGKLTLTDVTVESVSSIVDTIKNRGELTLAGNTTVANGSNSAILNITYQHEEEHQIPVVLNISENTVSVGKIIVDLNEYEHPTLGAVNKANPIINISAGTIESIATTGETKTVENGVSGGVFSNPVPQNACADGYMPKENGNGIYGVQECAGISGSVASYGEDDFAVTTIELLSGANVVTSTGVEGNSGEYQFDSVANGTYTIRVSKNGHVTREYSITLTGTAVVQDVKICLKGDVTGDGKINVLDINKLFGHVNEKIVLDDYAKACGSVTDDSTVNIMDVNELFKFVNEQIDSL